MTTTTGETTAIERYLQAVREELADLPDDERIDLLEDVEQHLLEVAAEADDESLETRLGPPAEYAAELRTAAGLPTRMSQDDPFTRRIAARISRSRIARAASRVNAQLRSSPKYRGGAEFVRSLGPSGWVIRGYLLTRLLGAATSSSGHRWQLVPQMWDSRIAGLLTLAILVPASVAWSRAVHERRATIRWVTLASGIAIVIATLTADAGTYRQSVPQPVPTPSVGPNGKLLNIYPYAADGTPLTDVLLYDQDGNPIIGAGNDPFVEEHGYHDANGQLVPNAFPYPNAVIDPRTGQVVGERQPPKIVPPPSAQSEPPLKQ